MIVLWLLVFVLFWGAYYFFTQGAVTRHLGFLHYAVYFLGIYLGAYQLYVENGSVNDKFIISVMMYPVCGFLGMILAQGVGKNTYYDARRIDYNKREAILVIWVTLFLLGVYGVYLYSLGSEIPLLRLISSGEATEARLARYLATKGYQGKGVGGLRLFFWLPRVLIEYFATFIVVFAYYRVRAIQSSYFGLLIPFVGLAFLAFLEVEKYPVVKLVAVLSLCHFNYNCTRLTFRRIMLGLLIAFGVLFFMGFVYCVAGGYYLSLAAGMSFFERIVFTGELGWELLATRAFLGQVQPLYVIYEIVPRFYDFFLGTTLTNPRGILPYKAIPLPFLVFDYYNLSEPGIQGSDPTVFYGEVYANWGLIISFISMISFGFIIQMIHHALSVKIDRLGTAFDIAFFYMIFIYLADFSLSFSTIYFDERFWFFVMLYMLRRLFIRYKMPRAVAL